MPTTFSFIQLPVKTEQFHLQQRALLEIACDQSVHAVLRAQKAFTYIAGIDEQGHLVGFNPNSNESLESFTPYVENLQKLCIGLTATNAPSLEKISEYCEVTSFTSELSIQQVPYEIKNGQSMRIHSITSHDTFRPQLCFSYTSNSAIRESRSIINAYAQYIKINDETQTLYIDELQANNNQDITPSLLKKHILNCFPNHSDATVIRGKNNSLFFLSTKGSIEKCSWFTWSDLLELLCSCELPKDTREYNIEAMETDQPTNNIALEFNRFTKKRAHAPSKDNNSQYQKRYKVST